MGYLVVSSNIHPRMRSETKDGGEKSHLPGNTTGGEFGFRVNLRNYDDKSGFAPA